MYSPLKWRIFRQISRRILHLSGEKKLWSWWVVAVVLVVAVEIPVVLHPASHNRDVGIIVND